MWNDLKGDTMIAAVVPEAYAAYRRPIAAALRYFVENLPTPRAVAIVAEQLELGMSAGAAERLTVLARACPVLHKLGQLLARDRRLEPGVRRQLQRLESMEPQVSIEAVRSRIEHDLGPIERLGLTLEPTALAEASVAVVVPFQSRDRSDGGAENGRGVFKVLKPGIEERLVQELEILEDVGAFLDQQCEALGIPPLDYRVVFAQVGDCLRDEVRLDREQSHLAEARTAYAGWESMVQIPRLLPWSSRRVTAMERIDGRKVGGDELHPPAERGAVARRIVEALVAQPLWSTAPTAIFHADPHAGNLIATPDGRLAILDWSLAGTLGVRAREAMAQVMIGALTLDERTILGALHTLAERAGDGPSLKRVVVGHVRRLSQGSAPGIGWLMRMLDDTVQSARLRFGNDMLMFRKVLLMLEGVVADVAGGTGIDLDATLAASFLRRLAGEWPGRAFAAPNSRAFGTRLSNADLGRLIGSIPWTTARVGFDWWRQWLALPEPSATP
jgi:ubiquinone biosynthesis protein